jgi:hypothetical protein
MQLGFIEREGYFIMWLLVLLFHVTKGDRATLCAAGGLFQCCNDVLDVGMAGLSLLLCAADV